MRSFINKLFGATGHKVVRCSTIDEMQRRAVENRELVDGMRRLNRELTDEMRRLNKESIDEMRRLSEASRYPQLPGTPYSQVAIPLEYPPSRDLQPRWGSTRPAITFFADWFDTRDYRPLLDGVRAAADELQDIPKLFDPVNLPEPAWLGVPIAPFDAAAIYMMVKRYRPRRYIEIGSGISTFFAHRAMTKYRIGTEIISIDPQPRAEIDAICTHMIRDGLETCDLSIFDSMQPGDILFMDGSHRTFMNSDVTVFMIDVLPRLKPRVIVHLHDIMLPYDYPNMFTNWYWSEQYMLAVYMMNAADRIEPLFPTAFVCRHPRYEDFFVTPLVDLGESNDGWRGGGSMWFTHTQPLKSPNPLQNAEEAVLTVNRTSGAD
jgi:hypothetical protein